MFARFVTLNEKVTNNRLQFIAGDFTCFVMEISIKHPRYVPSHLATKGQAEHIVQAFRKALIKAKPNSINLQQILDNFLLAYRLTPNGTMGKTLSTSQFGRNIQIPLKFIKPNSYDFVEKQ